MTTEEKIDQIFKKLTEKKTKDGWEKAQIAATICLGLFTIVLACINLLVTSRIADQSKKQAEEFHSDQLRQEQNDSIRKEREEFIQELAALPSIIKSFSDTNKNVQNIGYAVLQKLQTNPLFNGHPIATLSILLKAEKAPSNGGILYSTFNQSNEEQPFWVYLGQKEDGAWQTRFFDVGQLPKPGTVIKTIANVYKHDSKPMKIGEPDTWDLGRKTGIIKTGSTLTVVDTLTLPANNYWVLVK